MQKLTNFSQKFPILKKIAAKTNNTLKPEYQIIIIAVTTLLLTSFTCIGPLVTTLIGTFIPIKQTLLILKTSSNKTQNSGEEMRKLLIFWTCVFMLVSVDAYFGFVASFIPFYSEAKVLLLFYVYSSPHQVYDSFIAKIPDSWMLDFKGDFSGDLREAADAAREVLKNVDLKKDK